MTRRIEKERHAGAVKLNDNALKEWKRGATLTPKSYPGSLSEASNCFAHTSEGPCLTTHILGGRGGYSLSWLDPDLTAVERVPSHTPRGTRNERSSEGLAIKRDYEMASPTLLSGARSSVKALRRAQDFIRHYLSH